MKFKRVSNIKPKKGKPLNSKNFQIRNFRKFEQVSKKIGSVMTHAKREKTFCLAIKTTNNNLEIEQRAYK